MDSNFIESNYNLKVTAKVLLDQHFGTEIYAVDTETGKYIVKSVPLYAKNAELEGAVAEYLFHHGLKVARLLKNRQGSYTTETSKFRFTVQGYIEGETLPLNTAPEWFMKESAEFLGKAVNLLKDYDPLPLRFGKDFFSPETALEKKRQFELGLAEAKAAEKSNVIPIWEKQICHLDRISKFHIDTDKLTYANSHGDYHIGQVIVNGRDFTVVDWSSVSCLPLSFEVITSYVFASPACSEGRIDAAGLKSYINTFARYYPLTEYDIQAMPYVLYFWHCICNYHPDELVNLSESYRSIAELIQKLLDWLYEHVEELSKAVMIE